jgi:glycosyltransferase involved in cell wall biosynthesis
MAAISLTPVTIVIPCYNESVFAIRFLESLEATLASLPFAFCVLMVNDRSTDDTLALLKKFSFVSPNISLRVLNLKFNVGQQAAIYQGMVYAQTIHCDHFIVMDADGEDTPTAIPELLQHLDADIVNVVRSKRKESLQFKICYALYKTFFRMVAGKQMNFGNFCLIRRNVLESAVYSTFSHFAAFLSKQKGNIRYITFNREQRIGGRSKMGFKKLFYHAFRSFVEYGEDMLMLFFKSFILIMTALVITLGNVVYRKFISHTSIQGWFSTMITIQVNLAMTCFGFFVLGILLIHLNNSNSNSKSAIYEVQAYENT